MATWPLKRAGFSLFLCYSLLCVATPVVALGQVIPVEAPSPQTLQRISESIANRFTTTIPLKQCQYPRLWSDNTASVTLAHLVQETRSDQQNNTETGSTVTSRPFLPNTQANRLFNRITEHYRALGHSTPSALVVIESRTANAFIRRKTEVVLTQTLVTQVTDESELAFILAHEVAHIALGHTINGGVSAEVAADALALQVVTALGFDPCSGSSVLERLGSPAQLTLVSVAPRLNALHDKTFDRCG